MIQILPKKAGNSFVNTPSGRDCVETQEIEKSGDHKPFEASEKSLTGQMWPKIFSVFVSPVFTRLSTPVLH